MGPEEGCKLRGVRHGWHAGESMGHVGEVEPTRGASRHLGMRRKMAVAVCITAGWRNVRRIKDICVHKVQLYNMSEAIL